MEEPLNGEIESCQFSKRKSTACETELEFSSEHSQDSQPDHLSKPQRKQSLLANLPAPSSKQFETIILEESDSEEVEFLGKRSVPAASQQQTILEPAPEKHTATTQSKAQEEHIFTLSCQFGHKSTVLGEVHHAEENWCMTCRNLLGDLRKFAEERGGKCVTTILAPEVTFECGLGHQWTVAYKKATKGWCKDCKAKKKVLLKEMLHRENVRADEERKQRQNQLLEESRQRMLANEKNQREAQNQELSNFKLILEEITRIASKYAREYCQKDTNCDFNQALLLYQTLILPEKSLSTYLRSLSKEEQKKEFRRYTILLHPDKNSHPKAKQAFQKAYSLFTEQSN